MAPHDLQHRSRPVDTVAGLEANTLADGLFHGATWLLTAAGLWWLWKNVSRRRLTPDRKFLGWLIFGWGLFNVLDEVLFHALLDLHYMREGDNEWRTTSALAPSEPRNWSSAGSSRVPGTSVPVPLCCPSFKCRRPGENGRDDLGRLHRRGRRHRGGDHGRPHRVDLPHASRRQETSLTAFRPLSHLALVPTSKSLLAKLDRLDPQLAAKFSHRLGGSVS
jgi:hypothetical protein